MKNHALYNARARSFNALRPPNMHSFHAYLYASATLSLFLLARSATLFLALARSSSRSDAQPRARTLFLALSHALPRAPTLSHALARSSSRSHTLPRARTLSHALAHSSSLSHAQPRSPTQRAVIKYASRGLEEIRRVMIFWRQCLLGHASFKNFMYLPLGKPGEFFHKFPMS